MKTALITLAIFALPLAAGAAPIAAGSQLSITGFDQTVPVSVSVDVATGLTFPDALTGAFGTGSFAALGVCASGSCGSIQDIPDFAAFSGRINEVIANLPGGTVSLDLTAPLTITRLAADPAAGRLANLTIAGLGTLHETGYDATDAQFTLTTQGTAITTFSASSIGVATSIPEPVSLGLLGVGLLGLGMTRLKRG